jgi:hypothetical protein
MTPRLIGYKRSTTELQRRAVVPTLDELEDGDADLNSGEEMAAVNNSHSSVA